MYAPEEIEAQLAWMLQQPGAAEHTLRLWAAYAYVKEHQHPSLRDPWSQPARPPLEDPRDDDGDLDVSSACQALNLDPDVLHTAEDLRKRYLQLLLVHHPDKPTGSPAAFLRLRAAYELLRRNRQHVA